jgi:nucleoside-diphosphate-sugar epimerase
MKVLVTGGSGYLGQFLIVSLSNQQHQVAYTYLRTALDPSSCSATRFRVNLASGEGLEEAVLGFQPDVVINCAAVSQPAACEQDYQAARALNRPEQLVQALQQLQEQHGKTALLIHLSTDQVRACVTHTASIASHLTTLSQHTAALRSALACSHSFMPAHASLAFDHRCTTALGPGGVSQMPPTQSTHTGAAS